MFFTLFYIPNFVNCLLWWILLGFVLFWFLICCGFFLEFININHWAWIICNFWLRWRSDYRSWSNNWCCWIYNWVNDWEVRIRNSIIMILIGSIVIVWIVITIIISSTPTSWILITSLPLLTTFIIFSPSIGFSSIIRIYWVIYVLLW